MWSDYELKWIEEHKELIESKDLFRIFNELLRDPNRNSMETELGVIMASIIYICEGPGGLRWEIRKVYSGQEYELLLEPTNETIDDRFLIHFYKSFILKNLCNPENGEKMGKTILVEGIVNLNKGKKDFILKLWDECEKEVNF